MPFDENEILFIKSEITQVVSNLIETKVKTIIDIDKLQQFKK